MFVYELLSFKLPFDGQEQVKEFMLDGGRPQLTPSVRYQCIYAVMRCDDVIAGTVVPVQRARFDGSVVGAATGGPSVLESVGVDYDGAGVLPPTRRGRVERRRRGGPFWRIVQRSVALLVTKNESNIDFDSSS